MNPKRHRWSGVVALLILSTLGGWTVCSSGHAQENGPDRLPEVAVVAIKLRETELTTELPGRTSAYRIAEIRPQVNGMVQKRLFEEGTDVKAGQLLYQIDPAPLQVAYDMAKASLAKAQANLPSVKSKAERHKELLANKVVSQQTYDEAVTALALVQADIAYLQSAVEAARINLEYTRITAPFGGRIGRTTVRAGALVTAYQPTALTLLQQLDPIFVDVTQSSAELLRLRRSLEAGHLTTDSKNRKVRILLEDGTPYPLEGKLQFLDVTVDPTTGSFSVRIQVPNPEHLLLPGMFVRAVIQEGIAKKAIVIPQEAVSRNAKGEPVALIVDQANTVQQRKLTLDRAIGNEWLVSAGLAAGDRLIVEGLLNARPGSVVKASTVENAKVLDKTDATGRVSAAGN